MKRGENVVAFQPCADRSTHCLPLGRWLDARREHSSPLSGGIQDLFAVKFEQLFGGCLPFLWKCVRLISAYLLDCVRERMCPYLLSCSESTVCLSSFSHTHTHTLSLPLPPSSYSELLSVTTKYELCL